MSAREKEEEAPSKTPKGDTDSSKRLESRDKDGLRHKDAYHSKSNGDRSRMHKSRREEEEEEEEEGGRARGGSGRGSRHEEDSSRGKRSRGYGDDDGSHHDVRGKRSKGYNGEEGEGWGDGYGWEEEEGWGGRYGSERAGQRSIKPGGSRAAGSQHGYHRGDYEEGKGPPSAWDVAKAHGERRRASEQAAQLQARLAKNKDPAAVLDRKARVLAGGSAAGAAAPVAGNGTPTEGLAGKAGRRKDMDEGDLAAAEDLVMEEEKLAGVTEGKAGGKAGVVGAAGARIGGSRAGGRYREEDEEMHHMDEEEALALGKRGRAGLAVGRGGLAGRLGRYRELEEEEDMGDLAMDGRMRGRGMLGGKPAAAALGGMRGGRGYPPGYEEEEELGGMMLEDEMYEEDEEGYATAMMEGRRVMVPRRTPGMAAFAHNPAALLKQSMAGGGVVGGMGPRAMGMKPGGLVRGVGASMGMGAGVQGLTHPQMMNLPMSMAKMGMDPRNTASALGLGSEFMPVIAYAHRELLEVLKARNQPIILGRGGNLLTAPARGSGLPSRALASRLMATGSLDDAYAEEEAGYEVDEVEGDAGFGEGLEELAVPAHQGGPWMAPRGGADVSMRGAGPSRGVGFAARAAAAHLGGLGGAAYEGAPGPRWGAGGVGSRLAGRIAPPGPSAVAGAEAEGYPEEQEEAAAHAPHAPHVPHVAHAAGEGGGGVPRGSGKVPSKYVPRHDGGRGSDRGERGGSSHGGKGEDGGWQPQRDRKLIVPCPPEMVKHIIGRGGETIRSLQAGSGAHIFVNQDFPPDKEREVRISGASDCVDLAERMVTRIIDNGDNKGIQQVIQRVLGSGGRHDRDRHDSGRDRDYPEHYRMSSEASEPRSPEPDRWAHDKYSDDDGTSRSAGSTPPRKRR